MRMVRRMCGVSLRDRKTNEELRARMGIEEIRTVLRKDRLIWFGRVERKEVADWVSGC